MGEDRTGRQSGRRVTVDEAARHFGLTVDAIRKRVQRKRIAYEKDEAGRVRIILDEGETLQDESPDTTGPVAHDTLVERLREEVGYLRGEIARRDEELSRRDEELRRRDAALEREQKLTAMFAERLGALEAPDRDAGQVQTPTIMETHALTVGMIAIGTGVLAGVANPLLVSWTANPFLLAVLALWLFPPIFGYWLGRDTALLRAAIFAKIEDLQNVPTPRQSPNKPVSPRQDGIDDLQRRLESLPNRAPLYAGIVAIATGTTAYGFSNLVLDSLAEMDEAEMEPAMIVVGIVQVVLAAMFVLSTSSLALGRARLQAEAARPDDGVGTTAEASAAKTQARLGLVGTIITAVLTLIGVVFQALFGSGGSGG